MTKAKLDSWSEKKDKSSTYIGTKRIDASTYEAGTVIPHRLYDKFFDNISVKLMKGQKHKIKIICNDKEYYAKIDWVNYSEKSNRGPVIRIMLNDKKFKSLLVDNLNICYSYITKYKKENNGKPPRQIPEDVQEFIDFYKGDEIDTFIVKLINRDQLKSSEEIDEEDIIDDEVDIEEEKDIITSFASIDVIKEIHSYISSKGFSYDENIIKNLYISLKTKPFVILSGISGTGKSKIVELFAEAIGANSDNNRFKLIPVKPDWSDSTDLLGYRNIEGVFTPGIITLTAYEAMMNAEKPYVICLDEMNLARVEYYFSDILSIMETRKVNEDGKIVTNLLLSREQFGGDIEAMDKYGDVYLPENLYIVGTVNMDETTFPFSKKVLDRANTIEFNYVNLDYSFEDSNVQSVEAKNYHNNLLKSEFLKIVDCKEYKELGVKVISKLIEINNILQKYNQHFGYRVRDEIVFYMIYATKYNLLSYEVAFDMSITQKILPKISGSNEDVQALLLDLFDELNDTNYKGVSYLDENNLKEMETKSLGEYKLSNEKIIYMIRRFIRDGFTTFWQ